MKKLLCLFIALCGLSAIAESGEYRNFTNHSGKTIYARLVQYDTESEKVQLELKTKKKAWIQLVDLSQADQAYIQQYISEKPGRATEAPAATEHQIEIYNADLTYEKLEHHKNVFLYPEVRLKSSAMPGSEDSITRPVITLTVLYDLYGNDTLRTIRFYYDWELERWTEQPKMFSPAAESKAAPTCNLHELVSSTIENKRQSQYDNRSMKFKQRPRMLTSATRVWIGGEMVAEKIKKSLSHRPPKGWEQMIAE